MVRRAGEEPWRAQGWSSRASRRLAFSQEQVGALVQVGDGRWTGLPCGPCHQGSAETLVLGGRPGPCPPQAPGTVVGKGKGQGSGQPPACSGSSSDTSSASPSAGRG